MKVRRRRNHLRKQRPRREYYVVPDTDIVLVIRNKQIVTVIPREWVQV